MPTMRGSKGAHKPRITTGVVEPVVVDYQPSLISRRRAAERVDVPGDGVNALPVRDIPERLRHVDRTAATVAYRLASGNWGRVKPDPTDPAGVVVD